MFRQKIALLSLLGLFACATARNVQLSDRVDSFNESLRWSSLKAASAFMDDKNKSILMEKYGKTFQKSNIVEYSILDIGLNPSKTKGSVLVEFSGYDNLTQNLTYRQELQVWNYDSGKHNWVIQEARPVSKTNQ